MPLRRRLTCTAAIAAGLVALAGLLPALAQDRGRESVRVAYAGPPQTWPAPWIDPGVAFVELAAAPPPARHSPEAELGGRLFRDPLLSADGRIACASCHDPAHGFSVPEAVGRGIGGAPGRRNPPALFAVAGRPRLDWDGGGGNLSARVLAPLTAADEMGNTSLAPVIARLGASAHTADFTRLFGAEGASPRTLAAALVAYLETLDTLTRFDRFMAGDRAALSDTEVSGLHLFRTKARCANCHFGPRLTDEGFHNLRLSFFGEPAQDLGRFSVTGAADDAGRFRTVSLRHVSESPPFMHNGLFPTLEGVVNLYDRGGGEVWARNAREAARPLYGEAARRSPHLRPLGLTAGEKAALVAFLKAL
ncbi:cytochrome-c peroxidase [Xanthobacter oligotrophicus]|uniref:cytochrome-c peroxidase n=1 Tax=Xanthobacter oligotrophicus TaxID=2607286 RepID=UPI0011F36984|nr:cytochrome c peroxidase [Xanthobacter oligotrophicus]MCG5236267.1 cytochrome-c peroxidase [Xanthobacter oligotrophicus]